MESTLVAELISLLNETGKSLAVAESCTGGLLSAEIVRTSGVSSIYKGAVVSYANQIKEQVLGVSRSLILTNGAVSRPVAREMARGVRQKLESDWSCSITGIAGPGGGTPDKPVGTVCFGISGPGVDTTEQALFQGDREAIQKQAVEFALRLLLAALRGSPLKQ